MAKLLLFPTFSREKNRDSWQVCNYDTVTPTHKAVPYGPRKAIFARKERDVDHVTTMLIMQKMRRPHNCHEIATSHSSLQKLSSVALTGRDFM